MKRIKDLIYYMFYRVSEWYKYWNWDFDYGWRWDRRSPYYMSNIIVSQSIGFFVLSIIIFVLHYLFDKQFTYTGLVIITLIVALIVASIVVCITSVLIGDEEKKYKELAKKYKTEKNAKLKGWLIFAFIIGTFILYIVSLLTCGYSGY